MRRLLPSLLAIGVAGLLASGCASLIHPGPAQLAWAATRWPDATLDGLEAGREAYVRECAGCHFLARPTRLPPEDWDPLLDQMRDEEGVELSPEDREAILRFLASASAVPEVEGDAGGD